MHFTKLHLEITIDLKSAVSPAGKRHSGKTSAAAPTAAMLNRNALVGYPGAVVVPFATVRRCRCRLVRSRPPVPDVWGSWGGGAPLVPFVPLVFLRRLVPFVPACGSVLFLLRLLYPPPPILTVCCSGHAVTISSPASTTPYTTSTHRPTTPPTTPPLAEEPS